MRKFAYIVLSIVVVSVLANSRAQAEPKKAATDSQAAAATTITKEAAQKLVQQKYPGAQLISCEMGTVKDNSVWIVQFRRTGGNVAEKVMVDPQTGKISRL